jgi:dihydrolipoamide dehydrogenase
VPLSIVFSAPQTAVVGQGLAQLDAATIVTGKASFEDQGRARAAGRNRGRLHLYADGNTGQLRGAELCAPGGEHLAHLLALALTQKMTVHDMLGMPFYHPTLEEGLRTALRDAAGQLKQERPSDLSDCPAIGVPALE